MSSSPLPFRLYCAIGSVTVVFFACAAWLATWEYSTNWEAVVVLTLLGALGTNFRETEFREESGVSSTTVVFLAAMVLAGPFGAMLVGYFSSLCDLRSPTRQAYLFNPAMMGLMSGAGSATYLAAGGLYPVGAKTSPLDIFTNVALPMLAGYVVTIIVNALLIGVMVHIMRGQSILLVAMSMVRSLGLAYMVHVVLAILLVLLWEPVGIGPFSAALIIIPLMLTQWALNRDAAERRSHIRTVSTLMGALEVATPYSIGHSSRVAELADRIAPRLGIVGESADSLHFAALLHDLGLVSTSSRMPRGTGPGDVSYLAAVQGHPEAGVSMLADIDFLAPAIPGILHHHERFDGLGYPAGLAGSNIPLFARVIAVADAFDSLTTNRSYRGAAGSHDALTELRQRSGTHLDPDVVQALSEALVDQPWKSTRISEAVIESAADFNDHDDPAVSDGYAAWQPETDEAQA